MDGFYWDRFLRKSHNANGSMEIIIVPLNSKPQITNSKQIQMTKTPLAPSLSLGGEGKGEGEFQIFLDIGIYL